MKFRKFLELKYLEWQAGLGERKTVNEFASYLGVSQSSVSQWWNGERKPQGDFIRKLAEKLGLEVYDALDLDRPDPDLFYVQRVWDDLTPEERKFVRDSVEKYADQNNKANNTQTVLKKRRT